VLLTLKPGGEAHDAEESLRTLKFGLCAAKVTTVRTANCTKAKELEELEQEMGEVEEKLQELQVVEAEDTSALEAAQQAMRELEERKAKEARQVQLVLMIQRRLMIVFVQLVSTTSSIYEILKFGVSPKIQALFPEIARLIEESIKPWEMKTDKGIAGADTVIVRVYHKVEGWLSKWKDVLGVDHREMLAFPDEVSSAQAPHAPPPAPSAWVRSKVEALYDTTLDIQPDLFELENQKDEVATHYVRLCAALNAVDRLVVAAQADLLQRKDLDNETIAMAHILGCVLQHARQRLAERHAAVEDKGEEVVDHLNRCLSLDLGSFFTVLPGSKAFKPRLAACSSWQDVLPLAADILTRALDEIDNPTPMEQQEEEVEEDARGSQLGPGFCYLGSGSAAWISTVKGLRRLNVRKVAEDKHTGKFCAAKEGVALLKAHVDELCSESMAGRIQEALDSAEYLEPITLEADLEREPRLSVSKQPTVMRVRVKLVEEKTGKYSVHKHMQVQFLEVVTEIKSAASGVRRSSMKPVSPAKSFSKNMSQVVVDREITLNGEQWETLCTQLPKYQAQV